MIIAELIRRALSQHRDRTVITDGTTALSYADLAARSYRLVNALRSRGIVAGDRVATLGANDVTSLELMVGLALGGYVRVALHAMNSGSVHKDMLEAAGARALIVDSTYQAKCAADLASVESLDYIIVRNGADGSGLDYEQVLGAADPQDALVPVTQDSLLHLAYSSGASGRPTASMHTHGSWMHVTLDNAGMLPRVSAEDVYLAAAPLTHAASTVLYLLLARGASIRIMDRFDAQEALAIIERERCTITFMVPTMLQLLATQPNVAAFDLSTLRTIMYAGAPISVATARAAQQVFGKVLFQSYGQSECLPATCLTPEDHEIGVTSDESILRSAGRPCLSAIIRIVNDRGEVLPAGEVGEILVSTAGRMLGVYGDPEATAARITTDGFVHSNDIGYLDERGLLFVVDRKNDMIISGGFNIWPAEIENALLKHPEVRDAVVVGLPHPKWGETPNAVVVVDDPSTVTESELVALCKERIGSMKKPASVIVIREPLPRNELGKLSRRLVREIYWPELATAGPRAGGAQPTLLKGTS
ncbi:class I adenylate-forming enzyme family protein [Arthrobacter sp. 2MCAF15]|uniref:class I adenylate-forming enzyme family protein n=1 Tax=Arthrobacter sp. 2MCAF15 TaxID=3232984 RepID=UPI003F8EDC85